MGTPEISLADEWIEWPSGTRKEAVSPYLDKTRVIYDPVITTDPVPLGIVLNRSHVLAIDTYLDGSSTPSVTYTVKYGATMASGTELVVGGLTVTSASLTTFEPTYHGWIDKNSMLWAEITAKSGTVDSVTIIVRYRTRP